MLWLLGLAARAIAPFVERDMLESGGVKLMCELALAQDDNITVT
jgi:hypothetical protein